MKKLRAHIGKIKSGLHNFKEATTTKFAEQLYGTPPSTKPGAKNQGPNLEALEKIHKVTG